MRRSIRRNTKNSNNFKLKLYTFNGLCIMAVCALFYRNLSVSELSIPEIVFHVVPPYVQMLTTLIGSTLRETPIIRYRITSGNHRKTAVKSLHGIYWPLTIVCLIAGNWLRSFLDRFRSGFAENALQFFVCFVPVISEIRYCRTCTEFRNDFRDLNNLVVDERLTTKKLLAIRMKRNELNESARGKTSVAGAEVLSEVAAAAVATVFKIHRALRSTTERYGNAAAAAAAVVSPETAADLLDVFHHVLRLFALCKVSGDVANEANEIVRNLLNVNSNADENLENEVSFFLWETVNPRSEVRLVYGTFALGPRLFVSVLSWCVGFILILLQFRWPRTY